jgi:hypothetical protein
MMHDDLYAVLPDHVYTAIDPCAHLPPAQRSKLQEACKKSSSGALFRTAANFYKPLQLKVLAATPATAGSAAGSPAAADSRAPPPHSPVVLPSPDNRSQDPCGAPSPPGLDPGAPLSGGARPPGVTIYPPDSLCNLLGCGQNELDTEAASPARLSPVDRTSSDMDTDVTPLAGPPAKWASPSSVNQTPARRSLSSPRPRRPYLPALPLPGPQLRPGMSMDRVVAAANGTLDPPHDALELSRIKDVLRTTSFGGFLLQDVLYVARLGDTLPAPH